ncbi:carboxypeptidase regulatory-like domain-containing protein, partial [Fluviicola sp.]|uniref:carboxypeptidase regulatory-like domain-containing protein n=1 Tax=Fluviicola sp. TaxID=1917219 RepID=UPI0026225360
MQQHSILVLLISIFSLSFTGFSQTELTGKISDKQTSEMLMDVRVVLLSVPDSSVVKVAMTNEEGTYSMTDLTPGTYFLKVTSLEYSDQVKRIELPAGKTVMDFVMKTDTKLIEEVTVEAKAIRVEQKGDTTQYNA